LASGEIDVEEFQRRRDALQRDTLSTEEEMHHQAVGIVGLPDLIHRKEV
jgi:hypothetical protein